MSWSTYLQNTKNNPPHPLLKEALDYAKSKNAALDLGAGALNDTRAIVANGFTEVDVVDITSEIKELVEDVFKTLPSTQRVLFHNQSFNSFHYPKEQYDLINAQYSLPFANAENFIELWKKIEYSLAHGGIFTGTFFGVEDEWNDGTHTRIIFHQKTEVLELFRSPTWNIIKLEEKIDDRPIADGTIKHWHVFNVIAQKN
ncbi:class I SAM-dependent methyltransferase [Patescibacteria group bacterium]|nr:class I SAM-dependent methyltransferase [Patescibacteria group bacterium]